MPRSKTFTPTQAKLFAYIADHPDAESKEIAEAVGCVRNYVYWFLDWLTRNMVGAITSTKHGYTLNVRKREPQQPKLSEGPVKTYRVECRCGYHKRGHLYESPDPRRIGPCPACLKRQNNYVAGGSLGV